MYSTTHIPNSGIWSYPSIRLGFGLREAGPGQGLVQIVRVSFQDSLKKKKKLEQQK